MNYFSQQSPRLLYRKLTEADIPSWTEFFINNDRVRFLGFDKTKSADISATEWIHKQMERNTVGGFGQLAVIEKETGELIGVGGIIVRELKSKTEYEITYSLKPAFWGKGYGTEIAMHFKSFGLDNKISDHFISIIHKENEPSMHVARKNGMDMLYETEFLEMPVFVFGDKK